MSIYNNTQKKTINELFEDLVIKQKEAMSSKEEEISEEEFNSLEDKEEEIMDLDEQYYQKECENFFYPPEEDFIIFEDDFIGKMHRIYNSLDSNFFYLFENVSFSTFFDFIKDQKEYERNCREFPFSFFEEEYTEDDYKEFEKSEYNRCIKTIQATIFKELDLGISYIKLYKFFQHYDYNAINKEYNLINFSNNFNLLSINEE